MNKDVIVLEDKIVVKLGRDLDHHLTEMIREDIDREAEKNNIRKILFDFTNVNFMDSAGIGLIMGRYKRVQQKGGKIYVKGINSAVDRIFRISGLYKITEVIEN